MNCWVCLIGGRRGKDNEEKFVSLTMLQWSINDLLPLIDILIPFRSMLKGFKRLYRRYAKTPIYSLLANANISLTLLPFIWLLPFSVEPNSTLHGTTCLYFTLASKLFLAQRVAGVFMCLSIYHYNWTKRLPLGC